MKKVQRPNKGQGRFVISESDFFGATELAPRCDVIPVIDDDVRRRHDRRLRRSGSVGVCGAAAEGQVGRAQGKAPEQGSGSRRRREDRGTHRASSDLFHNFGFHAYPAYPEAHLAYPILCWLHKMCKIRGMRIRIRGMRVKIRGICTRDQFLVATNHKPQITNYKSQKGLNLQITKIQFFVAFVKMQKLIVAHLNL